MHTPILYRTEVFIIFPVQNPVRPVWDDETPRPPGKSARPPLSLLLPGRLEPSALTLPNVMTAMFNIF